MEFHEKLQKLRKDRGLTQEEMAESLYVSRTAISKWESGRGYPSIESLKAIAKFFSVTIDELLTGEELISVAEKENKSNIKSICDMMFGILDISTFVMIILPLYPNTFEGYIYSVNLFAYTETTNWIRLGYWSLYTGLILTGIVKLIFLKWKKEKGHKFITDFSIGIHILTVLFLGMAREAYATAVVFLLLVGKGILFFKSSK